MTGKELKTRRLSINGLTQEVLAAASGVPVGTIGRIEADEEKQISKVDTLNKLIMALEIEEKTPKPIEFSDNRNGLDDNLKWKSSGKDKKADKSKKVEELRRLMVEAGEKHTKTNSDENGKVYIGIPMYNFPGSASVVQMYGDDNTVGVVGHLNIPGAAIDSFALPVHGHSMYPFLENGNWCVLRPIADKTDIEYGEVYYIEYGDYRMYKRLLKADDPDSIILWSDNQTEMINDRPKYAPKTIKTDRIRRLCLLTDILKKPNY